MHKTKGRCPVPRDVLWDVQQVRLLPVNRGGGTVPGLNGKGSCSLTASLYEKVWTWIVLALRSVERGSRVLPQRCRVSHIRLVLSCDHPSDSNMCLTKSNRFDVYTRYRYYVRQWKRSSLDCVRQTIENSNYDSGNMTWAEARIHLEFECSTPY